MNKVVVIAEAGVNHNGSLENAKKLVDVAALAGADYVKFQTFVAKDNITKSAKKADYQIQNTQNSVESQLEMVKKLELSKSDHEVLYAYCNEKGVKFLSTAFDFTSIDLLEKFKLDYFKIPSGEITNLPYLRKAGSLLRPLILSTGMADLAEIETALKVLVEAGADQNQITVLHCNTEYPTPMSDVNLKAMNQIAEKFNVKVGYSDHTLGIEIPIAAVALGASMIEKHFTLDKNMEGPDHKASLEPEELINMVKAIRHIEVALGSGVKAPSPSEKKNLTIARKSLVALKSIQKGEVFNLGNLGVKRPGSGMSPMLWDRVLGSVATRDYSEDELIDE
ncbi:MAG: N-acetylneuraminate synthase [Bdellovibrionaceae bacterium]|nr:N-acetylneuraminate synthase [Pseudobdellovibrionaceae bacterium]